MNRNETRLLDYLNNESLADKPIKKIKSMNGNKAVLFLLPDCPGYFTELFYRMATVLKAKGFIPIFAITTPFYEKFKKVNLQVAGKVYYLDQFLSSAISEKEYEHLEINNWSYYSSFARQTYFFGRPLNSRMTLKKTKLFYEKIFRDNNVALLVSEGVSNVFLYLAHEQATANGIPYFGLMSSRIPYHFNVHVDIEGNGVLRNGMSAKEYVPSDALPDYMKNSKFGGVFDREYSFLSRSFFKEILQFLFMKNYKSLETGNTKWFLLKVYRIAIKRMLANFYFQKLLKIYDRHVKFDPGKVYVVYPLHFYPEASTSILGKYYDGNEFNLIRNIAFSLPENAVLVVKEHLANVGNNSSAFYKKVKQLPNVVLLDPYFKLKDNLGKFDAVTTISSTVGFEALTIGVPVYVLGEVFYQKYEGCHKLKSFFDMETQLSRIGKRSRILEKNHTFDEYFQICFPGSFNYMAPSCLHQDNVNLLLAPIMEYIEHGKMIIHRNN
jgi:hypothetical protein